MISRVKIKNFFQFKDLEVEFAPNFNCIVGANGSGKSNLINSIKYALVGNVNLRTKKDIIRLGTKGDEEASVTLYLLDENKKEVVIYRRIHPNNLVYLEYDGEQFYNHTNVLEKLCSIFGTHNHEMFEYCFILQRELDKYISMTTNERIKYLSKIFETSVVERINDKINKVILPLPTYEYKILEIKKLDSEVIKIENEIKELQNINKKITEELKAICGEEEDKINHYIKKITEERNELLKLQFLISKKSSVESEIKKLNNEIEGLEKMLEVKNSTYEKNLNDLNNTLGKFENFKMLMEYYKDQIEIYKKIEKNNELMKEIEEDKKRIVEIFRKRPKSSKNLSILTQKLNKTIFLLSKITTNLAVLTNKKNDYEKVLNTDICSFCKRPIKNDLNFYKSKDKELNLIYKLIDKRKKLVSSLREVKTNLEKQIEESNKRQELKNTLLFMIRQLREKKNKLYKIDKHPEVDFEEINKFKKEYDSLDLSIAYYKKYIKELENDIYKIKTMLHTKYNDLNNKKFELEKINTFSLMDKNLIDRKISELDEEIKKVTTFLNTLSNNNSLISYMENSIKEKSKNKEELNKKYEKRAYFEKIKKVFSSDGAVKLFVSNRMKVCEDVMNEILNLFDANFRVVCEDVDLKVIFSDSKEINDRFLSVGEKLILSLGWELATKISSFGFPPFLFFDEPAAGLDKDNISLFPEVLKKFKMYSKNKNLQIFIITHDNLSLDIFDKTILLSKGRIIN